MEIDSSSDEDNDSKKSSSSTSTTTSTSTNRKSTSNTSNTSNKKKRKTQAWSDLGIGDSFEICPKGDKFSFTFKVSALNKVTCECGETLNNAGLLSNHQLACHVKKKGHPQAQKDTSSKSITSFFTQRTSPPLIPERIDIFRGTEYTNSNSQHEVNESVDESEELVLLLKMLEVNGYETCSGIPLIFPEPLNKNVPHQLFDHFDFGFSIDKDSCAHSNKCTARNCLFKTTGNTDSTCSTNSSSSSSSSNNSNSNNNSSQSICSDCLLLQWDDVEPASWSDRMKPFGSADPRIIIRKILANAWNKTLYSTNTNTMYLTHAQRDQRDKQKSQQRGTVRLNNLNLDRDLAQLQKERTERDRIFQAMARGNVPLASKVIARSIKNGDSTKVLLEDMLAYQHGDWKPCSFEDKTYDRSYVVAKMGGHAALEACKELGLVSEKTLRNHNFGDIGKFMCSPCWFDDHWPMGINMLRNVFLAPFSSRDGLTTKVGHVLMLDDTTIEERKRVHPLHSWVMGNCQHAPLQLLEDHDDLLRIEQSHAAQGTEIGFCDCAETNSDGSKGACDCECKSHYASEATVIALGPIAKDNNHIRPINIQGTCKKDWNAIAASKQITFCINAYYADPRGADLQGPIFTVSTDGWSGFVKGMSDFEDHVCFGWLLSLLVVCKLFPLMVGIHDIVFNCDFKHCVKRFRERFKSKDKGMKIYNHTFVGKEDWQPFLSANGVPEQKITNMFCPKDGQNVPFVTLMLQEM